MTTGRSLALSALLVLGSGWAAAQPRAADERAESFLIVNPAGQGNQGMAQSFLAELAAALEAAWPAGARAPALVGRYHVTAADALASIKKNPPLFALTTTAFYLEHRDDLRLEVLLMPSREGAAASRVHVVARRGPTADAIVQGSVEGLALGGQLAGEPAWARGAVLAGLRGAAAAELVPVARTLDGVRRLQSGELDALLLHEADWLRLKEAGKAGGLASAHVSAVLPEGPVVALGRGEGASAAAARNLARDAARALQSLSGTPKGRAVLERMTLEGFKPATDKDYDAAARLLAPGGG